MLSIRKRNINCNWQAKKFILSFVDQLISNVVLLVLINQIAVLLISRSMSKKKELKIIPSIYMLSLWFVTYEKYSVIFFIVIVDFIEKNRCIIVGLHEKDFCLYMK